MFEVVRNGASVEGASDVKRFGVVLMAALVVLLGAARSASAAPYTADKAVKINVMGEWAHPDDDTSIIGPCGVWHQRYGVKCGIIMVTRGEGGGNAVASEIGPALGLRRENEDRVAHFRSGTVDIFNLDRVDFFYNQSAPLTQYFWNHDDALRRIPVVVLTTSKAEEDVLRSYDLHANAYVTKPVDFDRFIEVVRQIDEFFVSVVRLPGASDGH